MSSDQGQEQLTPAQVRMLQVQQQLIQTQFQEQSKRKAEENTGGSSQQQQGNYGNSTHMHESERGDGQVLENIPEDSTDTSHSNGNQLAERTSTGLSQQNLAALPNTSNKSNNKVPTSMQNVSHNGGQMHQNLNPNGNVSSSAVNSSGVNMNTSGMIPAESAYLYTDPRSTFQLAPGVGQGENQTMFVDPRLRGVPAESMHLFVDPRSIQNLSTNNGSNLHIPQQGYMQPIHSNTTLQMDPRTQALLQAQIAQQNNAAAQRQAAGQNSSYEVGPNDTTPADDIVKPKYEMYINDTTPTDNIVKPKYGLYINDTTPADDIVKPKSNPLSPRTRKLYYSLAVVGFIFWIVGLVGVSGTTSYTSDLLGGYDVLSKNHLRMAWFSFWLFVFMLFVTIIVVYLRGMNSSRALLMPVWTITILTLIIAADYALTLNDQLTFVPTNEGDLIKANNASYLSTTSNYIVVTYIGAILMIILSAFILFLTACYDRTQFLR